MAARFWILGTGTWDAVTTTNWSATSGGSGGASVPTSSDDVTFDANSGTSATVTISTVTANANTITINKSDLTLTHLLVGSTVVGAVTLTTGTLNTNGQACSWANFIGTGAVARTLTMGASAITITGTGTVWNCAVVTNLTITSNTATITCNNAAAATFSGGAINYNGTSLVMNNGGIATVSASGITLANLTRNGTAVKTDQLVISATTLNVTGEFKVVGNSPTNRVLVLSNVVGLARTVNAAVSSNHANVDWQDITGGGAGSPFTGASMGDAQGNTNITFDFPLTLYRVGAGGNWSASNWSLTSGGTTGQRVPLSQDTVNIDSGASGTVANDMPRLGANLNFTGFTGIFSFIVSGAIYGNFTFGAGMTTGGTSSIFDFGGRGAQTITSNGVTMSYRPRIICYTGSYTLQDAFTNVGSGALFTTGTFNSNNFNCSFPALTVQGATVNMGSSTWTLSSVAAIWTYTSGTINPGTSTIVSSNISATLRTFAGGGQTYNNFSYVVNGSTGQLNITGSNTFNVFNFSDTTNARTLAFTAATTNTFTTFNVNGTAGKLMTISSITAASHTLSKASGTVSDDYLLITNSIATGGASWYAGANSTDGGGNTGWQFSAPSSATSGGMLMMGIG